MSKYNFYLLFNYMRIEISILKILIRKKVKPD